MKKDTEVFDYYIFCEIKLIEHFNFFSLSCPNKFPHTFSVLIRRFVVLGPICSKLTMSLVNVSLKF